MGNLSNILKFWIPLLYCFASFNSKADTLTLRQIHSYSVGDTFQYYAKGFNRSGGLYSYFTTYVITAKYSSPNQDTLFVEKAINNGSNIKRDTITDLDSSINIIQLNLGGSPCQFYLNTNSAIWGRQENEKDKFCFESGESIRFAEGLGITGYNWYAGAGSDNENFEEKLIYYSNSDTFLGTSIDNFSGKPLTEPYIPIPEECAEWYTRVFANPNTDGQEYIKTDKIIIQNQKRWVSLRYTGYYPISQYFTRDSLIGYFRNDSINKKVFFKSNLDSNEVLLCDFSIVGSATIIISKKTFQHNIERTAWATNYGIQNGDLYYDKIGGIGSMRGFVNIQQRYSLFPPNVSSLTCFKVCNQVMFTDAGGRCSIVGIDDLPSIQHIKIVRNANHVSIENNWNSKLNVSIFNLNGQRIFGKAYQENEQIIIQLDQFNSGLYILRAENELEQVKIKISVMN